MTTQEQYVERLKEMVTAEYGRSIATPEDCIALSNAIAESVGVSIEAEALELLFINAGGHTAAPRPVVLSSLARYVGFTGWSDFCTARDITPADDQDALPVVRRWGVIILTAIAVIAVVIGAIALIRSGNSDDADSTTVDSRFRNIEAEWIARTSEHCNDKLQYYNSNEPEKYNRRIDKFIRNYSKHLHQNVRSSIERYAINNKITVDNETIDQTADIIITKCLDMCENIKIE